MKSIARKLTFFATTAVMMVGMFAATPKANAAVYLCFLDGCDNVYCYYDCYLIAE